MVEWAQSLIAVDDNDNFIRYAPRKECHTGEGVRHRGITLLIFNKDKKILLQKRKHDVFDNIWDLAGATHPVHNKDSDETYEQSGVRCMEAEWGVKTELKNILAYTYFEKYGSLCENEFCALLVGQFDSQLKPNSEHMYNHRWVTWKQLLDELSKEPENFTPWLKVAVEKLKADSFLPKIS